jgi:hypothetical protein
MNTLTKLLLVFIGGSTASFGIPFSGTITQTITQSNDPNYPVGVTFVGFYQYESDTIDGIFRTNAGSVYGPSDGLLTGFVFLAYPVGNGFEQLNDANTGSRGLEIVDGNVIAFSWRDEYINGTHNHAYINYGPGGGTFLNYGWLNYGSWDDEIYLSISGTVVVGAPRQIPDVAPSLGLLTLSMVVFAAVRRRLLRWSEWPKPTA